MLKDIRFHIEKDELKQAEIEAAHAANLERTLRQNVNAFQRHIPSVVPIISNTSTSSISVVCNKHGELNIVDFGIGRVLYGQHPKHEIHQQYKSFCERAPYADFSQQTKVLNDSAATIELKKLPAYHQFTKQTSFPDSAKLVIVLGLGLGHHIVDLIDNHNIEHLVIYEPEIQYAKCSAMTIEWQKILEKAKRQNTGLYFQFGKDGRDLLSDINELREHVLVEGAYLYQHYNHPIFNAISQQLLSTSWDELTDKGFSFNQFNKAGSYCPVWSESVDVDVYSDVDINADVFQGNLAAFEKYFPDIYKEFKSYKPKHWLPVVHENGEVNLIIMDRLVPLHGKSPVNESQGNFNGFKQYPNKDGLIFGYHGNKLRDYLHYRFVAKSETLLDEFEEDVGELPETIKSIILFGLGCGYQLDNLMNQHTVEKLFICEPNRDFFYASLFAIDWSEILEKIDKSESRIYLNIGDDGSNLFRDLLNQFYSIGPYILSNTYFYQCYYNDSLNEAISQLREQLQVVISMGEYFDHARYGITHTKEALLQGYHFLKSSPSQYLTYDDQQVPVFIVGNGPSVDHAINAIKENQNKAIIVSCGTALQVLYKHGIVPDFHAEIEQNRATFDWASRIKNPEYLKQINLLSCNGIHPDTCKLYKDVYIAFKTGESSSVSSLAVLGESNYESLAFAFPTVANFALNLFTKIGCQQIYLIGIDLGFVKKGEHHSKSSGYYSEGGKQLYDYDAKGNTSLQVPGNFRKTVFTKYEFKVSKVILEQTLAECSAVECYNLADGALIKGAIPLAVDNILLTTDESAKTQFLDSKSKAYADVQEEEFRQLYDSKFTVEQLTKDIDNFEKIIKRDVTTMEDAFQVIEDQRKAIFESYKSGKSLLFYLFYGTLNYANALLSKIIYASSDHEKVLARFNDAKEMWSESFELMAKDWTEQASNLDRCSSLAVYRINSRTIELLSREKLAIYFHDTDTLDYFSKMLQRGEVEHSLLDDISTLSVADMEAVNSSSKILLFVDLGKKCDIESVMSFCCAFPNKRVIVTSHTFDASLDVTSLLAYDNASLQLLWPNQTQFSQSNSDTCFMYSAAASDLIFFIWALASDVDIKLHVPRIKMAGEGTNLCAKHEKTWQAMRGIFNQVKLDWFASAHMLHGRVASEKTSIVDIQYVRSNKLLIEPELRDLVYGTMTNAEVLAKSRTKN
ncbi:DUF115 domain-containing protein [Paraglaciecola aquimarina]|uniref:DUF115 domain-containing protein n=1 Tax=Paraglaciecola algarum TaxID=3050085 RepID=A0ABS9D5A9_9ALTE|nr:6-hydroxymethylpterin diphosphokinase MptE-like protein [Paraglaciecola sp. G1-23]MCF2948121.1 DUF115 domain-containing protein [Paraglaciecola sp. G1-23]